MPWLTHFPLHDWLDSSKFGFADARHHSLLHNPAGVVLAGKIFKDLPTAKEIATEHIKEDLGEVKTIDQWLPEEFWPNGSKSPLDLKPKPEVSITDVKGSLFFNNPFPNDSHKDIRQCLDILLIPETTEKLETKDPRRFFFFSSAGPYICERLLGPTLGTKTPIATRSSVEFFIQKLWGLIPSHQDLLSQRPIVDWMWKKAKPLSKSLE